MDIEEKDIVGKIFGDWTVLSLIDLDKTKERKYLCRCSCGKEKPVFYKSLKSGDSKGCGCYWQKVSKVQIGFVFGEWTVLERGVSRNNHRLWLCRCSCGKNSWIESVELSSGSTKSCGHDKYKTKGDIKIGDRFGKWTVVEEERDGLLFIGFKCECDCGNIRIVQGYSLKSGHTTSCGCKRKIQISAGDKFGRLTVISEGKMRGIRRFILCKCECGTEKEIPLSNLMKENSTKSCGCLARELSSIRKSEYLSNPENVVSSRYYWYFLDGKNKIKCRSSYEVFIWNYFKFSLNEEIEYEKKVFKIDEETRYIPDFYLPRMNMYLEPKGTFFLNDSSRKQMVIIEKLSKTEKILVLFWEDIYKMCELPFSSLTTYLEKAKKLKISPEKYLAERIYYEYRGGYDSKRKGKKELNIQ